LDGLAGDLFDRRTNRLGLRLGDLPDPHRDVVLTVTGGRLDDGFGEARLGDGRTSLVRADRLGGRVLQLAATGELDAQIEVTHHDAGDRDDRDTERDDDPHAGPAHQVRAVLVQPAAGAGDA